MSVLIPVRTEPGLLHRFVSLDKKPNSTLVNIGCLHPGQVTSYKRVPAIIILGLTLRWTLILSIPSWEE